jgi:hypothetical protein
MDKTQFGAIYWCVKVTDELAEGKEIYVFADSVQETENGSLAFVRILPDGRTILNFLVSPSQWRAVYIADPADGSALAIEHWEEEIWEDDDSATPDDEDPSPEERASRRKPVVRPSKK